MDDTVFLHGSLPGWDIRVSMELKGGHQRDPCDYVGKVMCLFFIVLEWFVGQPYLPQVAVSFLCSL